MDEPLQVTIGPSLGFQLEGYVNRPYDSMEREVLEQRLRSLNRRRLYPLICMAALIAIGGVVAGVQIGSDVGLTVAVGIVAGSVMGGYAGYSAVESERDHLKAELSRKESIEGKAKGRRRKTETTDYFERLVEINILNLGRYYGLVKRHTDNSFVVSVAAGLFGLGLIAAGLVVGFTQDTESERVLGYVATGSGILTEFIAGVFFYLYNRTTRQLKDYHDSLLDVQNILLCFKIVQELDSGHKPEMMQHMLKSILRVEQPVARPAGES